MNINPHAHIEKQLAEVYLQRNEISKATTVLTNYINQNFNDIEAHNQLLHAYFLSSRWELGQEQAELALRLFPNNEMIGDNLILFKMLNGRYYEYLYVPITPFHKYNRGVYLNNEPEVWYRNKKPFLHTKLLFHEYKFRELSKSDNTFELNIGGKSVKVKDHIVAFGRKGYGSYPIDVFTGNAVSRLHFVIINHKNNVWLYDLDSFSGINVDGKPIHKKCFLLGLHSMEFGGHKLSLKTDTNILL